MASPSVSPSLTIEQKETVDSLVADIQHNNSEANDDARIKQRIALSKAITLVESKSPTRRLMADVLLDRLRKSTKIDTDQAGNTSFRLGIAGPPGVGKSTFVDAFGQYILSLNSNDSTKLSGNENFIPDKLAVLCIDPSSHVTGRSILGDKTRMSNLSYNPRAYVRPSPSSGTLGGLGAYTFDAVSLCELAGYNLTIVETVGVGQSEVELAECCDLFLLLLAPGGGDELQGSKKGIIEVADVLVVNKADGDLEAVARKTASEYKKAMGLLRKPVGWWGGSQNNDSECKSQFTSKQPVAPPVLLVSAKTGAGIPELYEKIVSYRKYAQSSGYLFQKRQKQNRYWMWKYLRERLLETTQQDERVKRKAAEIEHELDTGLIAPRTAASLLWNSIVGSADKTN
jgi:LAO/AO transport system kinase